MIVPRVVAIEIFRGLSIQGYAPSGYVGVVYSAAFSAINGTAPFTWSIAGTLPPSMSFSATGSTSAIASAGITTSDVGAWPVVLHLRDATRTRVYLNLTIKVVALPLSLSGHAPNGTVGVAYTPYTYSASGGYPPYTFSVTSGSLPSGLTLSSAGVLSGTPTAFGAYSWVVTLSDSGGGSISISDNCTVSTPALTLSGTYTSPVTVTSVYSSDLTIAGGSGTYSNPRVISGSLPAGTSISIASGNKLRVSGTVSTITNYSFVAAVDSSDGQTATSSQSINVQADAIALSIYNKIKVSAGGQGAYWNLTEPSGSRIDSANGNNLTQSGTNATATGPRGGSDVAFYANGTDGNLFRSRSAGDALDVPSGGGLHCFFGWANLSAQDGVRPLGGIWDASSSSALAYMLSIQGGKVYFFNGGSTYYYGSGLGPPSNGTWHFYVGWRGSDGKAVLEIDANGVTDASASASDPTTSTVPFSIGAVGSGGFLSNAAYSRFGYIKGAILTSAEQTWLMNSGNGRNWAEIEALAGH